MNVIKAGGAYPAWKPWAEGSEPLAGPGKGMRDARKVATEFAGLFYRMMIDEMEKTVPENEYFGSRGEAIFRSMWVDELGTRLAARKGDVLTETIMAQMERS